MSSRPVVHRAPRRAFPIIVTVVALLMLCSGIALAIGQYILPADGRMATGVSVAGADLSGLTKTAAAQRLREVLLPRIDANITLRAGRGMQTNSLRQLGIAPDIDATLAAALAVGHDGTLAERILASYDAHFSGLTVAPVFRQDDDVLTRALGQFSRRINHEPHNASGRWDDATQRLVIMPEKAGARLDIPASVKMIRQDILPQVAKGTTPAEYTLPYREKIPRVTAQMLSAIDTLLSAHTTSFGSSTRNRAKNVTTAAAAINGVVVLPGEEFSFNTVVGPRTKAEGFVEAPVIMDGQLQPGMGGGVCQVSTTLYNAALYANMDITRRSHHSLPIHYAPQGLDATVSYGTIDFRFRNTTSAPVIIENLVTGRRLTARILGKGPTPKVRIERTGISALPGRTITKKDPTLPQGARLVEKRGTSGMAVTVIRVVGEGPDAKRETISHDRYLGEPRIVRVGTGKAIVQNNSTPSMVEARATAQ